MTLRLLFVFIHVVSAMGVFGTLAIEGALLLRLRRVADTADMLDALNGFRLLRFLAPLSLGLTVMSGMYLVRTVWGWRAAWINVALASSAWRVSRKCRHWRCCVSSPASHVAVNAHTTSSMCVMRCAPSAFASNVSSANAGVAISARMTSARIT